MLSPAPATPDEAFDELVERLRLAGCVWAEDEARVLWDTGARGPALERLLARRVAGEPLETVVGWVQFLGRRLSVARGVFVPRRRTELLARLARSWSGPGRVSVELCCGVAPVAASIEDGRVHAADVSPAALDLARVNAPRAHHHLGDLYDALPRDLHGRVDVLAANAPYVPDAEIDLMPPEARHHEPWEALAGGPDGVDWHRRIALDAPAWLSPGGVLLVETSTRQAPLTAAAMSAVGLAVDVVTDEGTGGCVAVGVRPGEPG